MWTMAQFDLRQRLRDKSVIIFAVIVPLALMTVLNFVIPSSEEDVELEPITIAASVPEGDETAAGLVSAFDEMEGLDITVDEVDAETARSRAEDGTATVALIVPDGFGDAISSGDQADVAVVEGDGSGLESDIVVSIVQGIVQRMDAGSVAARAGLQVGIAPEQIGSVVQSVVTAEPAVSLTEGTVSVEQLDASGTLVAGQAGLFLLFTTGFGVLALVTEREQGTLARLRSMPMPTWQISGAKVLVSAILGIVATAILLTVGGLLFGVDFGNPALIACLIVAVVLAATSLGMLIIRIARTSEQASIAQTISAMVFGIAGGAFFPMAVSGIAGRILDLNPITAFIRGLGITAGGGSLGDIAVPVVTMLGFAIVVGAISRLIPDRGTAL
jgi:ABC-2 type transport system permease protein